MSNHKIESLKQDIYRFNEWVRSNNVPISEAIIRHYEIHGEFAAIQRKSLGYLPYPNDELSILPAGVENYSMGAYNPCKYAEIRNGDKVLDIGCGAGIDSFLATSGAGKNGMVIGVDVTFLLLQKANQFRKPLSKASKMLFIQASGDALPIAEKSIDVIISNCCLHLIGNKPKAFAEFFRVLRPGGRAILADVVAEDDRLENFYDNPLMYLYSGGGKKTPEEYESLAKSAGFLDVKFKKEKQHWDIGNEPMPGGYFILKKGEEQ